MKMRSVRTDSFVTATAARTPTITRMSASDVPWTARSFHQLAFRQRVLSAYRESCALWRLRHVELLGAAHILPDAHPLGEPVVSNGLAMCKLHHAAFDRQIVGIRPDLIVEVREDVLEEVDGPMLRHGLQDLQGNRLLVLPTRPAQRPNPEFLAVRYDLFRSAS